MKILVCGKGGSGKSVIATLIAKELSRRGNEVLLLDADESNQSLGRFFGVEVKELTDFLGGKENVREKLFNFIQSGEREETSLRPATRN